MSGALLLNLFGCAVQMPGKSFSGPLPPATEPQKELASQLHRDISREAYPARRRSLARRQRLGGDIHHRGATGGIDMGKDTGGFFHPRILR